MRMNQKIWMKWRFEGATRVRQWSIATRRFEPGSDERDERQEKLQYELDTRKNTSLRLNLDACIFLHYRWFLSILRKFGY